MMRAPKLWSSTRALLGVLGRAVRRRHGAHTREPERPHFGNSHCTQAFSLFLFSSAQTYFLCHHRRKPWSQIESKAKLPAFLRSQLTT
jgi:hypothetical protein